MNRLSGSELAGVCFSPDGRTMFVNIQQQGLTLAISGPFRRA
jgi:secreted PhoX family phosphatase